MELTRLCSCGRETIINVDKNDYAAYESGVKVQEAFPKLNAFEREVIISGTCFDCQSKMFNTPKPGEDWGDILVRCQNCETPIYAKEMYDDRHYVCPCCGEDGELP